MSRKENPPATGSRAHEKQQLILSSALQEFVTHGYTAASMDRISEKAGVSKATVYNHFKDKETLYGALIDQKVESACFIDLKALPPPGSLSPAEHIERLADVMGCQPDDPEAENLINFMRMTIAESGRFPGLAQTFVRRVEKPINEFLAQYLRECGIATEDALPIAWIISGTFIYQIIIMQVMSGSEIMPIDLRYLASTLGKLIGSYAEKSEKYGKTNFTNTSL